MFLKKRDFLRFWSLITQLLVDIWPSKFFDEFFYEFRLYWCFKKSLFWQKVSHTHKQAKWWKLIIYFILFFSKWKHEPQYLIHFFLTSWHGRKKQQNFAPSELLLKREEKNKQIQTFNRISQNNNKGYFSTNEHQLTCFFFWFITSISNLSSCSF